MKDDEYAWTSSRPTVPKQPSADLSKALASAHGDAQTWAKNLTPLLRTKLAEAIDNNSISTSDMIKLATLLDDRVDGKVADRVNIKIDTKTEVTLALQILEQAGVTIDKGFVEALENGAT